MRALVFAPRVQPRVAGGKRLARSRPRAPVMATAARAPIAVPYRLGQEIVEVAEVRCAAGEICDDN
jgi:hypothetical protein